jgi:hypothetical protein
MPKVIGLMTAWAAEDWIVPAINNHLKICDEMIIASVPFHPKFVALDPMAKTLEKLTDTFYSNKKITIMPFRACKASDGNESFKCEILNRMLQVQLPDQGDILMICDVDEFYDDLAIAELQEEFLKNDWDRLDVCSRFFCINMQWHVNSDHPRFIKYNDRRFYFKPTQNPVPYRKFIKKILSENPMFHYSMLMSLAFKRTHWETEKINFNRKKLQWLNELYANYDPTNIERCKALGEKNKQYFGRKGFWLKNTVVESPDPPYLFQYTGPHPIEIERSPMRNKKDFR